MDDKSEAELLAELETARATKAMLRRYTEEWCEAGYLVARLTEAIRKKRMAGKTGR